METPWLAKRPVSALRPGDHGWLAYSGLEERDRVIGPFVREGLETTEKVVYVTDAPPDRLPGLGSGHRIDVDAHRRTGALRVISLRDACLDRHGDFEPARMVDTLGREVGEAFDQGFRAVRITTDHSWLVNGPRRSDLGQVLGCEHRVGDTVSPSTMAMAICQIDRRACSPAELIALRDTHEVLVEVNPEFDDGILKIVRTFEPDGLRVEGELDAARHAVFAEQLSQVNTGRGRVHLDFSRLAFIDLGGLHLLAKHATLRPGGEPLVLDHLSPHVENVIEMVGWHRLPGLVRGGDEGPRPGSGGVG
ncbi:STAS domain-containing protein [Actinomadura spongiicola]|uniref:STAS domain-containing protein n=1 Tax=Actinomadura spongiicola TaxID=2303421 RepID=A0A372G9P7_9ACTN|nr:MEDS domain-containing protein [Actinomadura spongiicola]RFS81869.1 STAS domain-containing protein [Actinomadura spongiicola]